MTPDITFIFKLRPTVTKDEKTGMFSARLRDFPQLIAYDKTEDDALTRLDNLFELLLNEKQDLVIKTLVEQQISVLIKDHQMRISRISKPIKGQLDKQLQLEMVTQ